LEFIPEPVRNRFVIWSLELGILKRGVIK